MIMRIKSTTLLTVVLTLFYFFPGVYANSYTNYVKYALLVIGIFQIIKHNKLIPGCNGFIVLSLIYHFIIYFISLYRGLAYANFANFVAILLLGIYLFYIKLLLLYDKRGTIDALFFVFSLLILWDLLIILIYPNGIHGISTPYGSQFLFGNKNNHTIHILIFLFVSYWKASYTERFRKTIIILSCGLSLVVVFLLSSSTTIVSIGIAVVGVLWQSFVIRKIEIKAKIVLISGIVLNFLVILGKATFLSPIVEAFGKTMTFTNRSIIWDQTIPYIIQKPILGWGHVDTNTVYGLFGYINTHNQFLDTCFLGGVIAFSSLIVILILLAQNIDKMVSPFEISTLSLLFLALLVKMLFEQVASSHIAWLFMFLLYEYSLFSRAINSNKSQVSINKGGFLY